MPKTTTDNPKKRFIVCRATEAEFDAIDKAWKAKHYTDRSKFALDAIKAYMTT